jgi:hypothetical protein
MTPTRADCCGYGFHSRIPAKTGKHSANQVHFDTLEQIEKAIESLTDPITGSPSHGRSVSGILCPHVDDLFCVGDKELYQHVVSSIQRDYHIGSEDTNDVLFGGQGGRWKSENNQ